MAKTVINNTKEQERKARKIYINKVKRFARSKAGLKILKQIAPEAALMIEAHPDWLDIAQYYNDPRLSGNYRVDFYDRLFYTGESGNVLLRISEHVYNYCYSADAFGHKYDPTERIPAKFEVFARGCTDKAMRELMEAKVIEVLHPILQWTDPEAPEYGSDKPIPEDETRESMRPDICVYTNLKIERFRAIQDAYKKQQGDKK